MSDYANYDAVIQSILSSDAEVDKKYKTVGNASSTLCDINQTVNQIQDMTVVRNRGGEVIGYDYHYTTPQLPDTSIMEVDSNSDNGWYGTGGGGHSSGGGAGRSRSSSYAGQIETDEGSTDKMKSGGLVSGLISAAWAGASALSKFGKNVGVAAADAVETLGAGLGSAFNDLMVDSANATGDAIRALFGVDSEGNTTMYLDEDTLGAIAITARDGGFFDSSEGTMPPAEFRDKIPGPLKTLKFATEKQITYSGTTYNVMKIGEGTRASYAIDVLLGFDINVTVDNLYFAFFLSNGASSSIISECAIMTIDGSSPPTPTLLFAYGTNVRYSSRFGAFGNSNKFTYNGKSSSTLGLSSISNKYYDNYVITVTSLISSCTAVRGSISDNWSVNVYQDLARLGWSALYGSSIQPVPGVSDQTGATVPVDAITGADPHVVAENLASQYPQVMGSPVQITVMDDSCNQVTKKYYSVPISYSPTNLNINAPITGGLQVSPSFNPDVSLDLPDINLDNYVDQIIKVLGGSGAGRNVTTEPEPEDPDTPSTDIVGGTLPVVTPKTGEGDTPAVVPPTVDVTSMWHIYNPSPESLYALGAWLWSANIWEQIVRMFSNPMEAIMGVHAIYAVPEISSQVPIVVGNLTSTANANKVTAQYKSIDCGEVWFTEYFGNVFDYEPFTSVQLYLPFIGIVPLSVADCMRAKIGVTYTIDFYTGACVAKVSVTRDGAGGVIYEYPGNCATEYPVSSSSYSRMIQSIVASAMSAVSVGMHTQGAPGTAALGAAAAAGTFIGSGEKFQVQHSGSFSGNHGAMGSKIPYLIISRPQTNMAINFEKYDGYRSNYTTQLSSCSGYTKCKEVHLNCPGAYKQELDEIESLLLSGVIFSSI